MARTGRPPDSGKPRGKVVPVRMSADEVKRLDRDRGAESRSDYVRKRLFGSQ
jgi:hypothetical protein